MVAQRDKDEAKGEMVKPKMASLGFRFFFFNRQNLVPAKILILAEIGHNGRNDPKLAEIRPEVEHEVFSYQFAYRYEIFWPRNQ